LDSLSLELFLELQAESVENGLFVGN